MLFGARTMSPFILDAENDSQKSLGPQESSSPLETLRDILLTSTLAYFLPTFPATFPLKLMLLILGVKS